MLPAAQNPFLNSCLSCSQIKNNPPDADPGMKALVPLANLYLVPAKLPL
jgi:hypothetical protein